MLFQINNWSRRMACKALKTLHVCLNRMKPQVW